jgi:uncharacterized protein
MPRLVPVLLASLLTVALASPGSAQAGTGAPPRAKEAAIRELLELTGAGKLGQQVVLQLVPALKASMPQLPEAFWTSFTQDVNPEEMVDLVVPIYAAHFTSEEIEQLVVFYKSPIGRRVTAELPVVMQESMAAGQQWGARLGQRAYDKAMALEKKKSE